MHKTVINLAQVCTTHCHVTRFNTIDRRAQRKLIIASILGVVFMVGEVISVLWLSDCNQIATDAAHLLGDLAVFFVLSRCSHCVAQRPSTHSFSFGYHLGGDGDSRLVGHLWALGISAFHIEVKYHKLSLLGSVA